MRNEHRIADIIEPTVTDMGFDLVRVKLSGQVRVALQVMIEPTGGERAVNVDDCANVSRAISTLLEVEDPIKGAYTLEVSSPGLDRPLTRKQDFDRFSGLEAKIELADAVDGRRRFKGRLGGVTGSGSIMLAADDADYEIPFEQIDTAKLVLNDELLALAEESERQ